MEPSEILERTRQLIQNSAGGDPDRLFYVNRYVFARLQMDERKSKTDIKRQLINANMPCHGCGQIIGSKSGIHLHRLDGLRGYRPDNCVLMHAECHYRLHSSQDQHSERLNYSILEGTLRKESKHYDSTFIYWWDITPNLISKLDEFDAIEFVKRDTGEAAHIEVNELRLYLAPERQTSRGTGNWGVKVLKSRPDCLAFEPGTGGTDWIFHPVIWINPNEED